MRQIYILVDCDGEACSGFEDKTKAIEEAQSCGLDVEEIPFYGSGKLEAELVKANLTIERLEAGLVMSSCQVKRKV